MKDIIETLEVMRFDVEGILKDALTAFPNLPHMTCTSQGLRAQVVCDYLNKLPLDGRIGWIDRQMKLQDFLTIRNAVEILERP